ncbi:MAG: UDP-N-acetylmuramoyl-tripeptide--D-alanyl-D-alanine ligase [Solobacterium sp.]|nr:UDP-N-acetylmuramoyl-tripeptide--D-alanyl-D-alanine ligase [Solobacterium sp.]
MMKFLWLFSILLAGLLPGRRALHIFQQNRYEPGRQISWLKENLHLIIAKSGDRTALILISCVAGVLLKDPANRIVQIVLCLLLGGLMYASEKQQKYIKPLVFTARVKRQIAVMLVLGALVLAVLYLFDLKLLSVLTAAVGPWLLVFPMFWITEPIEASVRNWYKNQAKKILADMNSLIKIGITGSYGKTSTKNIMQAMISERYNSLMTPASYNTPMGITRTIREELKPIHQVFVCEMGADHVGDITELMEFVKPTIGVVTSIGPQHLNTFGSQENIIKEKMQEIELLPADGLGILNYDNDFIRQYRVKNNVKTVSYGIRHTEADYVARDIVYTPTGSSFTVVNNGEEHRIETKLLGELNILNILSAIAAARYLQVDWRTIARAAKAMKQVEHRLELKKINGFRFIDDAFNANPAGSAMALEVLSMMPNTRCIVTPGMIDLGEKQDEINRAFGAKMKDKADLVILVGVQQTKPIYEGLKESGFAMDHVLVVDKVKEAFAYVYSHLTPQDTILLENDLPDAFNH